EIAEAGFAVLPFAAVTHQLDIEALRKRHPQRGEHRLGRVALAVREQPADWPARPARQTDQSLCGRGEIGERDRRFGARVAVEEGAADQREKGAVTGLVLHQEHEAVWLDRRPRRGTVAGPPAARPAPGPIAAGARTG